jgi:mannose-6-phosphate isomerase-like protein (cupin superfamily)
MREGRAVVRGTLSVWPQVGRSVGAQAISLRVMEFAPGISPELHNADCDEIIYVLTGAGRVVIAGQPYPVEPETGIYLRPHETLRVDNPGPAPLVLISSQCPEPSEGADIVTTRTAYPASTAPPVRAPIVRLAERKAVPTADRRFRVLIDDEVGSLQVTQFVGSIPPGRAPDHFHNYEEVLFILRGTGRMWAGATSTPISAGSCIYLPRRQTHCVENTGDGELRLLGVFYPAGSPSVRYESSEEV